MILTLRYLLGCVAYAAMWLLGCMLLNPLLPLFATMRDGPANNGMHHAIEPRLPRCLAWFDTSTDNSLWGDTGWRRLHAPRLWGSYLGMVLWLYRNTVSGFSWTVLAHDVAVDEVFTVTMSGPDIDLSFDKNQYRNGWFYIRSNRGAFQFRWVRIVGRLRFAFECGWQIDPYVRSAGTGRAIFMFQPQINPARMV